MHFQIQNREQGVRLDILLTKKIPNLGRAGAKRLIEEHRVHVNGKAVPKGYSVQSGDQIEIKHLLEEEITISAVADPTLNLRVLFEDEDLVCVEKPAGIQSHPLRPGETNTVASALVAMFPQMKSVGFSEREPGILHRLDKGTSGVMLAAKNTQMFDALKHLQKNAGIQKMYLALSQGPSEIPQTLKASLRTDPVNPKKMSVCDVDHPKALDAETRMISSKKINEKFQLNTIHITNGRRHQIRAHMASIGFPLAGDTLYEGLCVQGLNRPFLHAHQIAFRHPNTKQKICVTSDLTEELQSILSTLQSE